MSQLAVFGRALRAYSFPATIIPVLCAALIVRANHPAGASIRGALLMLAASLPLHAGTNMLNDYHDFKRGLDDELSAGGSGVLAERLVTPGVLRRWALLLMAGGALAGTYLAITTNPLLFPLGICGLAGGYFYSHERGYKYLGLGEPLVFLLMGPLLFCSAFLAAGGDIGLETLLLSLPFACLVTAIMLVNNMRDIAGDRSAGLITLPMRLGPSASGALFAFLLLAPPLMAAFFAVSGLLPRGASLAAIIVLPAALLALRALRRGALEQVADLRGTPEKTAMLYLAFGALLALGLVL